MEKTCKGPIDMDFIYTRCVEVCRRRLEPAMTRAELLCIQVCVEEGVKALCRGVETT